VICRASGSTIQYSGTFAFVFLPFLYQVAPPVFWTATDDFQEQIRAVRLTQVVFFPTRPDKHNVGFAILALHDSYRERSRHNLPEFLLHDELIEQKQQVFEDPLMKNRRHGKELQAAVVELHEATNVEFQIGFFAPFALIGIVQGHLPNGLADRRNAAAEAEFGCNKVHVSSRIASAANALHSITFGALPATDRTVVALYRVQEQPRS
jgi:hypothetical protein